MEDCKTTKNKKNKVACISFSGKVNANTAEEICSSFEYLVDEHVNEIHFGINSTGGSMEDVWFLANFINALPIRLITHNLGCIESAAVIVFLAGDIRIACVNSGFMIHGINRWWRPNSKGRISLTHPQLVKALEIAKDFNQRSANYIASKTKLDAGDIMDMYEKGIEKRIASDEAKDLGFINEIADWTIPKEAEHIYITDVPEKNK